MGISYGVRERLCRRERVLGNIMCTAKNKKKVLGEILCFRSVEQLCVRLKECVLGK